MAIIYSLKCTGPFSFAVTHCHSLLLVVTLCHSLYRSLSLFVPLVVTRCRSLSLVVIRCHLFSLVESLVVIRCTFVVTRCDSLSLVVTRCTTRLSFLKRSLQTVLCFFLPSLLFPETSKQLYIHAEKSSWVIRHNGRFANFINILWNTFVRAHFWWSLSMFTRKFTKKELLPSYFCRVPLVFWAES